MIFLVYCLISGNRICDIGLENLCKVLNTIPNLVYLGLACNDVTVEGLKSLCAAVSIENSKALQVTWLFKSVFRMEKYTFYATKWNVKVGKKKLFSLTLLNFLNWFIHLSIWCWLTTLPTCSCSIWYLKG